MSGRSEGWNASSLLWDNLEAGRGDRTAVLCGDEAWSYASLAAEAARVGNGLLSLGLRPGDRVLLLMLDSPGFPAAFMGALRAGIVPIPANTVLHPDDYRYLLEDSGARAALIDAPLLERFGSPARSVRTLEHRIVRGGGDQAGDAVAWDIWTQAQPTELAPHRPHPDSAAFWLYSSGSTGFPKGVLHRHRDVRATIDCYGRGVLSISESDVTFSASKIFHAYGLGNNLTFPYAVGATTVLFPGRPTPEAIFDVIARTRPTLFFAVPTLYVAMLAHAEAVGGTQSDLGGVLDDLGRMRLAISAAEALPPETYRAWKARFGVEILDGIGSTEMLHIFISNQPGRVRPGASGELVPGYDARVVDERGEPLPPGESGDLLVRGESASPGYWNRPERTAHTMRGDWVFTGDRYRVDEDGFYYYEGRSDDMLKVGGQWVSPVEIENTLAEHPAVLESAVVAQEVDGLVRPAAHVILRDGARPSDGLAAELQDFVKARVAPYKYPRSIVFVEELPKTATGKIQRFRLRT